MTSTATQPVSAPRAGVSAKSRLLPYNRKVRHLHGITIRNLSFSPPSHRSRARTIDDEALPYSLKSPTKLLAASEQGKITHSRSFTDLKSEAKSPTELHNDSEAVHNAWPSQPSPPAKRRQPQRRTTLDWANSSPTQRRDSLRDAVLRRTVNVFFSLHCNGVQDPVYISEMVETTFNPNFRFFDLSILNAVVSRQDSIVVNIWASNVEEGGWHHVLELGAELQHLQFIGQSLEELNFQLPENCVVFHLQDGLYISVAELDLRREAGVESPAPGSIASEVPQPTSSYDALMRLATLDEGVQEAILTREKLTADINSLLAQDKPRFRTSNEISTAQDSAQSLQRAKDSERRHINLLEARIKDTRSSLSKRREQMQSSEFSQSAKENFKDKHGVELDTLQASHTALQSPMQGQRRRICTDLAFIYPIDPIPNKPLLFTIRSLPLPNSVFTKADISTNADALSAALGHTAHLTHLLSQYLSIALPYPIDPRSSISTIVDPISLSLTGSAAPSSTTPAATDPDRRFPLHLAKSTPLYRLEYAVFLLNKDIELLAAKLGLRVMDIRQTLPNLKYVLYVATAGDGEVPARKAGGFRGLLHASSVSRRGSDTAGDAGAGAGGSRPPSIRGGTEGAVTDVADALRKRVALRGHSPQGDVRNGEIPRAGAARLASAGKVTAAVEL